MIKADIKFKKKKLTVEQKALRKAITPLAKQIKNEVKGAAPKSTGALKFSIGSKIISRQGSAAAIVGVKAQYAKDVKGKQKIPNKYALKVGMIPIIKSFVNESTVDRLKDAVADIVKELTQ